MDVCVEVGAGEIARSTTVEDRICTMGGLFSPYISHASPLSMPRSFPCSPRLLVNGHRSGPSWSCSHGPVGLSLTDHSPFVTIHLQPDDPIQLAGLDSCHPSIQPPFTSRLSPLASLPSRSTGNLIRPTPIRPPCAATMSTAARRRLMRDFKVFHPPATYAGHNLTTASSAHANRPSRRRLRISRA